MNKNLLISTIILLAIISTVHATPIVENNGITIGTTALDNGAEAIGFQISTNQTALMKITNVTGATGVTASYAYVIDNSNAIICRWAMGSQTSCSLPAAGTYIVALGNDGANYNKAYTSFSSYPVKGQILNWTADKYVQCTPWTVGGSCTVTTTSTSFAENVQTITFDNDTAPVDELHYSGVTRTTNTPGINVNFSATVTSTVNANITNATFGFDNGTGTLTNLTTITLSGKSANVSYTTRVNSTVGATIRYQWYFRATNSTTTLKNDTAVTSYITNQTRTGLTNYTKYGSNPVGTVNLTTGFATVAHGEMSTWEENGTIYQLYHTHSATVHHLAIVNGTNPYDMNTNNYELSTLRGFTFPFMALTLNQSPRINGNFTLFVNNVTTSNIEVFTASNPYGPWNRACANPITTTGNFGNPAVYYDNATGVWHMVVDNATNSYYSDYWNSTSLCTGWTDRATNIGGFNSLNAYMSKFNDTFLMYFSQYNASMTDYYSAWAKGNSLTNMTIQQNDVFAGLAVQAAETGAGGGVLDWSDQDFLIIPEADQSLFPGLPSWYFYYLADQNNTFVATDTDQRTFYVAHNVSALYTTTGGGGGGGGSSSWNSTYPLLNSSETNFWSGNTSINRSDFYDKLISDQQLSGNVTYNLGGNLWVPWYSTSTSCLVSDLQAGSNCNIGVTVDATHNCMVNDEFSQVAIQASMSNNATLMDQAYNTMVTTRSTRGTIPTWKVWRNNTNIMVCSVTNTNCDTASDGTARTIISLYNAANNTAFSTGNRSKYLALANNMTADMLQYEIVQSCKPSHLGFGPICYWLAGGSVVKSSGTGAGYFVYTGYFPDAQIAFLQACANTQNATYCAVAGNISLNYLQAAYPNSYNWSTSGVRVPPGKAFHWANTSTDAGPVCDDTCSPIQWDPIDASRALGFCEANYYARRINQNNSAQETYCTGLGNMHFNSSTSTPLQFYPNGTNSASYQSGFQAQGLAALHQMGGHNQSLFNSTLNNALGHYTSSTKTFDSTACFGVYNEAFSIRALGEGIGRNLASWPSNITLTGGTGGSPLINITNVSFFQNPVRANDDAICRAYTNYTGSETNLTFTYNVSANGTTASSGTAYGGPNTFVNVSTLDHLYISRGTNLTCAVTVTDGFQTSNTANGTVTVLGALPVLQTAIISSLNNILNCTYTNTDLENDTITAAHYKWYVNGTTNSTGQTLNVTTYATNSTAICQVTITDQDGNSTPLNTTNYYVGDNAAPNITSVSIPTTGTVTDVLQITATVTDDHSLAQGTPVIQFTDPNGQILGNYTMSNNTPTSFYYNRTYNTVGTYNNFKIYAIDGSGNIATYNHTGTLVISLGTSSGSGSSGAFQPSTGPNTCAFSVIQPVNGYLNPICPAGLKSGSFTVTLYNDQGTTQNYQASTTGTDCKISDTSFSIEPKTTKVVTISDCSCPATGDAVKGQITFKNSQCGNTVQVALYSNFISRLINDNSIILTAALGMAGAVILLVILIALFRAS